MEVMEKKVESQAAQEDERSRFQAVVKARKTPSDFIALFDKLAKSDMFSSAVKPWCFVHLIEQSRNVVPDHFFAKLMTAVEASKAVAAVVSLGEKTADATFAPLVRRSLEVAPTQAEELTEVFLSLERMGVTRNRGDTLGLALEAGMEEDTLGALCNISFEGYYGITLQSRLVAAEV